MTSIMIKFLDIQKITELYSSEIHSAASRVIDSGWYLLGKRLMPLKKNLQIT